MISKFLVDPDGEDSMKIVLFMKKISYPIADKLKNTSITPNQITFLSFLTGIISGLFFYLAEPSFLIIGAILIFISYMLDYMDGRLAKIRNMRTRLGGFLDHVSDSSKHAIVFFGVVWGIYNATGDFKIWIFGFSAAASYLLARLTHEMFRRYFMEIADDITNKEKKARGIIKEFFYDGNQVMILTVIGAIFNRLDWIIMLFGIYGPIFVVGQFIMLVARIKQKDPKGFPYPKKN